MKYLVKCSTQSIEYSLSSFFFFFKIPKDKHKLVWKIWNHVAHTMDAITQTKRIVDACFNTLG